MLARGVLPRELHTVCDRERGAMPLLSACVRGHFGVKVGAALSGNGLPQRNPGALAAEGSLKREERREAGAEF